jgi:hypothetical protein
MGSPKEIIGVTVRDHLRGERDQPGRLRVVRSAGMSFESSNGDLMVKLDNKASLPKLINLLSGSEVTYDEVLIKGAP